MVMIDLRSNQWQIHETEKNVSGRSFSAHSSILLMGHTAFILRSTRTCVIDSHP